MNSFTHRLLAKMVHQRLEEKLGIKLSRRHLVWGSVKPDFVKTQISHFKDEKIDQFYKQWEKVCNIDPINNLEYFSEELGVVLHFLCDYFCTAHNCENLKIEILPHLRYENRVHKIAKKLSREFFQVSYADYSQISFQEIFNYKHKLYLNKPYSIINDLSFSFEICMISAEKLFEEACVTVTHNIG